MKIKRGVAVVTYNRGRRLKEVVESIRDTSPNGSRIVVCDDGSRDTSHNVLSNLGITWISGNNLGVGANKNRGLYLLQDCHFISIIEDDLVATESGWFDIYEEVALTTGINHFCRVQDKEIPETLPEFSDWLKSSGGYTPVYGSSPRGDLTFITSRVIHEVGGLNPLFQGVGYAHGEWSERVARANLIPHPLKWIDIKEARDKFIQKGDREGGRWEVDKDVIKSQINKNKKIAAQLSKSTNLFQPLTLP